MVKQFLFTADNGRQRPTRVTYVPRDLIHPHPVLHTASLARGLHPARFQAKQSTCRVWKANMILILSAALLAGLINMRSLGQPSAQIFLYAPPTATTASARQSPSVQM